MSDERNARETILEVLALSQHVQPACTCPSQRAIVQPKDFSSVLFKAEIEGFPPSFHHQSLSHKHMQIYIASLVCLGAGAAIQGSARPDSLRACMVRRSGAGNGWHRIIRNRMRCHELVLVCVVVPMFSRGPALLYACRRERVRERLSLRLVTWG